MSLSSHQSKENRMYKVVLATLKKMLVALMGERLVAKVTFSFLEWLAEQSETQIDNDIVKEWKDVYYGTADRTRQTE